MQGWARAQAEKTEELRKLQLVSDEQRALLQRLRGGQGGPGEAAAWTGPGVGASPSGPHHGKSWEEGRLDGEAGMEDDLLAGLLRAGREEGWLGPLGQEGQDEFHLSAARADLNWEDSGSAGYLVTATPIASRTHAGRQPSVADEFARGLRSGKRDESPGGDGAYGGHGGHGYGSAEGVWWQQVARIRDAQELLQSEVGRLG